MKDKYITLNDSECEIVSMELRVSVEDLCSSIDLPDILEHYDEEDVVEWVITEGSEPLMLIERLRDEQLGTRSLQTLFEGTLEAVSSPTRGSLHDCIEAITDWTAKPDTTRARDLLSSLLDNMTDDAILDVLTTHERTKALVGQRQAPSSVSAVEYAKLRGLDVEALMKDTVEVLENAAALVQCIGIINGLITKDPTNTVKAPMYAALTSSRDRLKQFWEMVSHEYEEMRKDGRIASDEAEQMLDAAHEAMHLEPEEAVAQKAAAQMLDAAAQSSSGT